MLHARQYASGAVLAAPLALVIDYTRRPKAYIAGISPWLHENLPRVLPSVFWIDLFAVLVLLAVFAVYLIRQHMSNNPNGPIHREIAAAERTFTNAARCAKSFEMQLFEAMFHRHTPVADASAPTLQSHGGLLTPHPIGETSTMSTPTSPLQPIGSFAQALLTAAEQNVPKLLAYLSSKNVQIESLIIAAAEKQSPFLGMIARALGGEIINLLGGEEAALVAALEALATKEVARIPA